MERKETIKIVLDAIQSKKDLLENELDKYSLDKLQNNRINKFKDSLEECNKYYEFLEEIQ